MRWSIVTALLILLPMITNCGNKEVENQYQKTEAQIERAIREYDVESHTRVFSTLDGATAFIEKFLLSYDEIQMVGDWHGSLLIEPNMWGTKGLGFSISFLPNKVFIAYDKEQIDNASGNYDFTRYFFKIGNWKVVERELLIQPIAIYRIDRDYLAAMGERTALKAKYYPIWKVDLFESAAVQKTLFNYRRVPMRIRKRFRLIQDEFRRVRRLIPLSFDGFRDDLFNPEKPWFKFLMNPDLSDEQYVRNLKIMEYLGGGSGHRYDFARNVGGLDFSRWK